MPINIVPLDRRGTSPTLPRVAGSGAAVSTMREGEGKRTIGAVLDEAAAALAAAGFDEPRRHARRLVAAALEMPAAAVFAYPERGLVAWEEIQVGTILNRMLAGEPLSRILGMREFWGLELRLSADTLDPRPDSETLVEAVRAHLPDRAAPYRFLDLGTGTGALLLALLSEFPRAGGVGVDFAPGAVATARENARRLGLAGRAHFIAGDWALPLDGTFDAIVANPPYIPNAAIAELPPAVRDHDPLLALDGGGDGLAAYRAIAGDLPRLLRPDGVFAGEIGAGQSGAVAAILGRAGLRVERLASDLAGIIRCVVARL